MKKTTVEIPQKKNESHKMIICILFGASFYGSRYLVARFVCCLIIEKNRRKKIDAPKNTRLTLSDIRAWFL